jgi:hypothetical protein
VLKECEEDGVVMKVLRYRIGMFKGQKAMTAAVYGFPKGGESLPALVQIHGGAQFTDASGLWKINYADTVAGFNGGTGSNFVTVTAVPELSATGLLILAVMGMLARRRR